MNVDDALRIPVDEIRRQHAHVFRQHQVVRRVGREDGLDRAFVLTPADARVRHMMKRYVEPFGERFLDRVIADDREDLRAELAVRVAHEQLAEAVVLGADQDHHARIVCAPETHVRARQRRPQLLQQGGHRLAAGKLSPHEETFAVAIDELGVRDNVGAGTGKQPGDLVYQAPAIRAVHEEKLGPLCDGGGIRRHDVH